MPPPNPTTMPSGRPSGRLAMRPASRPLKASTKRLGKTWTLRSARFLGCPAVNHAEVVEFTRAPQAAAPHGPERPARIAAVRVLEAIGFHVIVPQTVCCGRPLISQGILVEAKLLADYGDCGKPVCCNTHLSQMPTVSMKMAKLQKATLDPTKISGRCGRLKREGKKTSVISAMT